MHTIYFEGQKYILKSLISMILWYIVGWCFQPISKSHFIHFFSSIAFLTWLLTSSQLKFLLLLNSYLILCFNFCFLDDMRKHAHTPCCVVSLFFLTLHNRLQHHNKILAFTIISTSLFWFLFFWFVCRCPLFQPCFFLFNLVNSLWFRRRF